MAGFEVWDVVRVPFPYTNRPVQQYRPALVLAQHQIAGSPHLLWVLMITSATHRRWHSDVEIADLEAAGLPAPSTVRTAKIATIEAGEAQAIGKLPPADRSKIKDLLNKAIP